MDLTLYKKYKKQLASYPIDINALNFMIWFAEERKRIWVLKEHLDRPAPWTNDPILRDQRFLNVERTEDKTTKAIIQKAEFLFSAEAVLMFLFIARAVNRQVLIDQIDIHKMADKEYLGAILADSTSFSNVYPLTDLTYKGKMYSYTDFVINVLPEELTNIVDYMSDCKFATPKSMTEHFNKLLNPINDFVIFQIVLDLGHLFPQIINMRGETHVGPGAAPFLEIMADQYATDVDIVMQMAAEKLVEKNLIRMKHPYLVENLACECRKYWGYKLGTKVPNDINTYNY